jgi:SSS family solute:Na+ symporter
LIAAYPSLSGMLGPYAGIAWPWYVLIGTTITLTVGSLSSLSHAAPPSGMTRR